MIPRENNSFTKTLSQICCFSALFKLCRCVCVSWASHTLAALKICRCNGFQSFGTAKCAVPLNWMHYNGFSHTVVSQPWEQRRIVSQVKFGLFSLQCFNNVCLSEILKLVFLFIYASVSATVMLQWKLEVQYGEPVTWVSNFFLLIRGQQPQQRNPHFLLPSPLQLIWQKTVFLG